MGKYTGDIKELSGTLALAYGPHVVSGHVIQKVTEGTGDTAQTTVVVWLGEGPWNQIRGAYWGGGLIGPENYHFHPGYLADNNDVAVEAVNPASGLNEWNQGVDPWNAGGLTYSGTAYVIVRLPAGIDSEDDLGKLKFVCECLRVADYDEDGNQLDKDGNTVAGPTEAPDSDWFFYSTNPALVMADLLLVRRGLPKSRINWPAWKIWKDFNAASITWVGGSIPDRPPFMNVSSNFLEGANASGLKSGGGNAWNCGAVTESLFPDNTISFFEVDAGPGTWAAGISTATTVTNSNQFYLGAQGNAATPLDESGILSINIGGVNTAFSTWVMGDRFRFGCDIVSGTPELYIAKNGVRLDFSSAGATPAFVSGLHGCIALFHDGAEILRSTMSPINTGTGTERTRPRFECGLAFPTRTDMSSAIEAVLYVSCAEMQDGELLTFLPPSTTGSPRTSVFDFDESIILSETFSTYRLARDQKPTKLTGRFRDADTPTLKEDTVDAFRDDVVDLLGRENPGPETYLGTITRGQAQCVMNYYIRRQSDLDLYCNFEATGVSWKVLPGDVVRVTKDETNWSNLKFEVIEAFDLSSTDTPDNRKFLCQIFNEGAYSDTDQTPLNANVTDLITNELGAPDTPTGFTATFLLNAVKYKWDKPANFNLIKEYEIWNTNDTSNPANRLWHGLADGWTEPFTSGAPNSVTRYVRAISLVGVASAFANVTQNIATVVAPTSYVLSYDNNALHHSFSPSNPATGIIRYEIATDSGFSNIIFSALDTQFDEVVSGAGTPTRYLRAVGILEKYSSTVVSNTATVGVPSPPTNAISSYDGTIIKWNWDASPTSNIAYYEITNSAGTVILDRVPYLHWEQPQVRGTSTYSSRVYAVSRSGLRSTSFLTLGYTIPAPNPISGLSVAYDTTTGLIKWSYTASSSNDIESVVFADNAGSLPTLVANKAATSITEQPTSGVVSLQRNVTVISTNGQSSSVVSTTFNAPSVATPTIGLNRQYPTVADVNVSGSITAKATRSTVIVVSTGTGAGFTAGIIQTLTEDGKQERVSVFGRVSAQANLYVKVQYIDVWGQTGSLSNELALTFTTIASGDIGSLGASNLPDGILTAAMFASGIRPVQVFTASTTTLPALPDDNYPSDVAVIYWPNATDVANRGLWRNEANVWQHYVDGSAIVADSITAGQIAAGAISADEIAANAIRADKLAVGLGNNMILNSSFEDGTSSGWIGRSGSSLIGTVTTLSDAPNGDRVMRLADTQSAVSKVVPVVPGKKYLIRTRLRSTNGTGSHFFFVYEKANKPVSDYIDDSGAESSTTLRNNVANSTITSWTSESAAAYTYTVPAGVYWISLVVIHAGSGTGNVDVDDFDCSPIIGGAYIADAAIGTAHIQDLAVTLAKIDTATINTLTAHNVYADHIIAAVGEVGLLFAESLVSRDYAPWVDASNQLNGAIDNDDTTVTVDSTTGFLSSAAFQIDDEIIYYTGKTSTTFTGCTRGRDGTTATAHLDNAVVTAKGKGWKGNPERGTSNPGVFEMHSGALIQNVPMREVQARATHSTDQHGYYRGPDREVVQGNAITFMFLEEHFSDGEIDKTYVSIVMNIDTYRDSNGLANAASIDHVELTIRDKFGDVAGVLPVRYSAWTGRGTAWAGWYDRKYADSEFEAAFTLRIHNSLGYSAPFHVTGNPTLQGSWGSFFSVTSPPSFLAKQNCPLELTATPTAPDTVVLNWSHAVANQGSQTVKMRFKGADNRWSSWADIATGVSSTANTYTWSNALQYTSYEFQILNTGLSGAYSNIAFCRTPPQSTTVASGNRVAPSGVVGSSVSSTSIVWSWTVNATDNTDVEYSLDGGSWTSLASATATTTTSTVSAGTTHTLRVRNKWSSGTTYSPEATSNSVTTPTDNPATNDPSNLNLLTFTQGEIDASWTNNGAVAITLEYKLSSDSSWTSTGDLGVVSSHNISGLLDATFYDVRVRATSGSNYATAPPVRTLVPVDPDPWCVILDSEISLAAWNTREARYMKSNDYIRTGKSNISNVSASLFGTTTGIFFLTNEFGDVLGCSASHPLVTNLEETTWESAQSISNRLQNGEEVRVKMNDNGNEYLAKIIATDWVKGNFDVWIPALLHDDHTFIANKFVSHNVREKL